uniref:Major Facilitator Superfamily protein n=1 Tax=Candidatus Kentrum sp. LFY TaxID=2126342 RepID=A0A450V397_9GAMM|nr:MAG: hypothetical protein BECKLFY1418B_GA0070995_11394 [Candidatus Kentron sp. LFY]
MRPDHFGLLVMSLILSITAGHFLLGLLAKKRFTARFLVVTGVLTCLLGGFPMVVFSGELTIVRTMVPLMIFVIGFTLSISQAMNMALASFPHAAGSASAMLGFVHMGLAGLLNITTGPLYGGTATPLGWIMLGMAGTALVIYAGLVRERRFSRT